jgi:hypothetical protein
MEKISQSKIKSLVVIDERKNIKILKSNLEVNPIWNLFFSKNEINEGQ